MKLVSWNICCDNGNPRAINELVENENPDILCLQEVSESLLKQLGLLNKQYPFSTQAVDHYVDGFLGLFHRKPSYLIILSKIPFEGDGIRYVHKKSGVRTILARVCGWHECVEHQGVDIIIQGTIWRILNIHIGCADKPKRKQMQFERVVQYFNSTGVTIVCGDFNIITTPEPSHLPRYIYRKLVKTHSIKDLLVGDIQEKFARRFKELGMKDFFRGMVTHPDSGMSLDKILVPIEFTTYCEYSVSSEMYGSDHLPLIVNFDRQISI